MNIYSNLLDKYTQVQWKVQWKVNSNVAYSCYRFRTNMFSINKEIEHFVNEYLQ